MYSFYFIWHYMYLHTATKDKLWPCEPFGSGKDQDIKEYGQKKSVLFMFHWGKNYIPANCPDFIGTVPIFDFQNLQKLEHPDFLEFQPVNIQVFNIIFKT